MLNSVIVIVVLLLFMWFVNYLFFRWNCLQFNDNGKSQTILLNSLALSTTNLSGVGGDNVTATTRASYIWLSVQRLFVLVPQSLLFSDVIDQILNSKKE